jgi:hypothetical protein
MNKRLNNNVTEIKANNSSDLSKSIKENERKSNFSFSYQKNVDKPEIKRDVHNKNLSY